LRTPTVAVVAQVGLILLEGFKPLPK
jgi:hypothetical protein